MDSFLALNTYPIKQFIINEDSGNIAMREAIRAKYGHVFTRIIFNGKREGLSRSFDNLIEEVQTEYVFTSEDDWNYTGNQNFIADSIAILEARKDIHQVWIRDATDHQHPLGIQTRIGGVLCRPVRAGYQTYWNGFSTNPGLRRMSDLKRMFPNGLREFGDEIECAKHTAKFNYKAVSLIHSACKHIGWGRHTQGFKI